jgi:hypothetical protein
MSEQQGPGDTIGESPCTAPRLGRADRGPATLFPLLFLVTVNCGGPPSPASSPSPGRWAGAQRIGGTPEPVPNCNPVESPQVGMDGRGGAMAAWLSECAIWTARYVPGQGWLQPEAIAGLPVGAAANWLWEPLLAVNDSGTALVVWATEDDIFRGRQLWARRWESATGWTPAERIDGLQAGQLEPTFPSAVALDSVGNGLAVWISEGTVAARFVVGSGWVAPERIGGPAAFPFPAVSFDTLGRAFATWSEGGTAVVRRFEPRLGWNPTTQFGPDSEGTFVGPGRVAFDNTGRGLLVYERSLGYYKPSSVWSALFGNDLWTPFSQLSAAGMGAGNPRIGLGSDGQGLAVWSELDGPSFARFDSLRGWGPSQTIPAVATGTGLVPPSWNLAVNARGDGFLVFLSQSPTLGRAQALATRYVTGQWESAQALQATSNYPGSPAIAVDPCGNATAVWLEIEGERPRIWANHFDTACR